MHTIILIIINKINCNKCKYECKILIIERIVCIGGIYENFLYFSVNFSVTLKLFQTYSLVKK